MRSFVLIAASLASLCAAAALPLDALSGSPAPGITDTISGSTGGLPRPDDLASTVEGLVGHASGPRARHEPSKDILDIFGDLSADIADYTADLEGYDDATNPTEVEQTLVKINAALETSLETLKSLTGETEQTLLTDDEGRLWAMADASPKIASVTNRLLAAAEHIIRLKIFDAVKVELTAVVQQAINVDVQVVQLLPNIVTDLDRDLQDPYGVVSYLGVHVDDGVKA